jgi:hypothetical protein
VRLTDRLRGIYTIPVNDGAGLLHGKDTFTPTEPFSTPPIQKEAADRIERLESAMVEVGEAISDQDYEGALIMIREAING